MECQALLNVIDREWCEHLDEMAVIRDSVQLSFLSGTDPLIEYQRRAVNQFADLLDRIKSATAGLLFNMTVTFEESEDDAPLGQHQ